MSNPTNIIRNRGQDIFKFTIYDLRFAISGFFHQSIIHIRQTLKIRTMNCPICNVTLLMADRQGVEIDYCPQCRGIWLDRGELEKIIERSLGASPPIEQGPPVFPPMGYNDGHGYKHGDHDDDHGSYDQYGRRRKKGFLGELFDF
jgi:Zn-finger nucleic acid-binding protein